MSYETMRFLLIIIVLVNIVFIIISLTKICLSYEKCVKTTGCYQPNKDQTTTPPKNKYLSQSEIKNIMIRRGIYGYSEPEIFRKKLKHNSWQTEKPANRKVTIINNTRPKLTCSVSDCIEASKEGRLPYSKLTPPKGSFS